MAFGLVYAALFTVFDTASWVAGLLIGTVHGLVIGLIAMPMMPAMHPRMEPALAGAAGRTVIETGGEVRVVAPGVMGSHWGGVTPLGVLMGHLIYGISVALVYRAML